MCRRLPRSRVCSGPNSSRSRQSAPKGGTSDRNHKPGGRQRCVERSGLLRAPRSRSCSPRRLPMRRCCSGRPRPSRSRKPRGCATTSSRASRAASTTSRPTTDPGSRASRPSSRPARARSACSARCTAASPACPTTWSTSPAIDLGGADRQRGLSRARHARHRASRSTCRGCRRPTSWPPTRRRCEFLPEGADINALTYDQLIAWSKAMAEADRLAEVRLSGRAGGAEAPLLPGLPAAVLHQLDGDEVPLRRGGGRLEHVQASSGSTPTPPRPATPSCSSRC